jgi:hypothetical protein
MAVDFATWLARSDKVRVFLVETSAVRASDLEVIPLYFADRGIVLNERAYLGCVVDLPRLTRQANDILDPNRVGTWGELTLARDDQVNPDALNTLSWDSLLSADYIFTGRPLTIFLGGLPEDGFAYEDYQIIFQGHIGAEDWKNDQVTLTLYDKGKDFDQEIGDETLPECPFVVEASWGQQVPLLLGMVPNYKPVLISDQETGSYPWRYALAAHVINQLTSVYFDNQPQGWTWNPQPNPWIGIREITSTPNMVFRQKDVLPAHKEGDGAATMQTFGLYSGVLYRAEWLVEIESITAPNEIGESGAEVGLARCRWFLNGVLQASNILTWKLAPGAVTKAPASVGIGNAAVAGEYTGEIKRDYHLKIVTEGRIGGTQTPQFAVSDDGGASFGSAIDIPNNDPIDIGRGLTAAFAGDVGSLGAVTRTAGAGSGAMIASGDFTGDVTTNYIFEVTGKGADYINVRWSNDNGSNWNGPTNVTVPTVIPWPIELGISVEFPNVAGDYEIGDTWEFSAYPPFVVDDEWSFGFVEIPIPLGDDVAIQFYTQTGVDFVVGDAWRFILASTLCLADVDDGVNITADAEGLISPADDLYQDRAGGIMQAVLMAWRDWQAADFDAAALAAFDGALPYQLGMLVDGPTAIADIFERLLTGIPALYTLDRQERLYLAEVVAPSGDPALELGDGDAEIIDSPEGRSGGDEVYRRVYLNYGRNNNPENSPANAPNQERLDWLKKEFRLARMALPISEDDALLARYPYAKDLGPLDTCIVQRAHALAAAGKLLNLLQTPRPPWTVNSPNLGAFLLNLADIVRWRESLRRLENLDLDFTQKQATLEFRS